MGLWDSFLNQFRAAYELEDLLRARAEVLGKGWCGTMYKASMDSGVAVAVKRFKPKLVFKKDFKANVQNIGYFDHENLVALRAYFSSNDETLLIYDYFPQGSLYSALHGNGGGVETPLSWETRAMIAHGTARGVEYIHSQGPTVFYHGSIKSSNILLSKNYEARVSDFDVSQLGIPVTYYPHSDEFFYYAPEVRGDHDIDEVSQKGDVYSYGVVLMEILTGKGPTSSTVNEEEKNLPRWVRSMARDDHEWSSEVFDAVLLDQFSIFEQQMIRLLQLAVDCTDDNPDNRPTIVDVTARIEQICGFTTVKRKQDVTVKATAQRFRELCLGPQ